MREVLKGRPDRGALFDVSHFCCFTGDKNPVTVLW
ncbi:hypothetical protein SHM7688_02687 [Shimia marina]|uniref:Uncharacterized protein n=1 Tax=Shimia marina TaxID=321267 RepID=A0A0P1ESG8_9RHOB|nr:hypothetical protein SHM7688_02687 [Shimia marina]